MKITSRLYLNYPQACFSNDIVTRFDLMRISVDLGNKQQQVDTVDICKRKSKTIMEITMLTFVEYNETLRLHRNSLHRID